MEYETGKSYDELKIGQKASFSKTISETDIYLFAGISGDFNPLHVNEAYAKTTRFKTRVAHGAIPESIMAQVIGVHLPGLGSIAVDHYTRFFRPAYIGDTITVTVEVIEKMEEKKRVKLGIIWVNQNGDKICEGWMQVVPPRANVK